MCLASHTFGSQGKHATVDFPYVHPKYSIDQFNNLSNCKSEYFDAKTGVGI